MRKRIFASALALFCVLGQVFAQNKVYFVHGLNDWSSTWRGLRDSLVSEKEDSSWKIDCAFNWSNEVSLSSVAGNLNSYINAQMQTSGSNAIVFGHSAGGVVTRRAAQGNGSRIRAIVTAGTPNHGAPIVSSVMNGSYFNVFERLSQRVGVAATATTAAAVSLGPVVGMSTAAVHVAASTAATTGAALGFIASPVIEAGVQNSSLGRAGCDLRPGCEFMNAVDSPYPEVPIINLYGNEDSPRLVNFLQTFDASFYSTYTNMVKTFADIEHGCRVAAQAS